MFVDGKPSDLNLTSNIEGAQCYEDSVKVSLNWIIIYASGGIILFKYCDVLLFTNNAIIVKW